MVTDSGLPCGSVTGVTTLPRLGTKETPVELLLTIVEVGSSRIYCIYI